MSKREPFLYLQDIINSIEKIENYINGLTFEEFAKNDEKKDASVRNLEIIGEAARNIPEETIIKHPEIPWKGMVGMRNKVIHEYFGVDEEILWQTLTKDLPTLKEQISNLLKQLEN